MSTPEEQQDEARFEDWNERTKGGTVSDNDSLDSILDDFHFGPTHHAAVKYQGAEEIENQARIADCNAKRDEAKAALNKYVVAKQAEAVTELKRRWHDDRKTMDYSPATYDFICDKYLAKLKEIGS